MPRTSRQNNHRIPAARADAGGGVLVTLKAAEVKDLIEELIDTALSESNWTRVQDLAGARDAVSLAGDDEDLVIRIELES